MKEKKTDVLWFPAENKMDASPFPMDDHSGDGERLRESVEVFLEDRSKENYIEILRILSDSYVWVPCNAVMSDHDLSKIEDLIEQADWDPDAIVGQTLSNDDEILMVPDLLQSQGDYFFPVFSSEAEMGKYGEPFSKVEQHMLDVIPWALSREVEVKGIVLNAFTQDFILPRELFDILGDMNSQLAD